MSQLDKPDLVLAAKIADILVGTKMYPFTFTNSDLVAGVLTITHNLNRLVVPVAIADQNGIGVVPSVTYLTEQQLTIDFSAIIPIGGTWHGTAG